MQDFRADPLVHDHVFLGSSHDENARRTLLVVALTAVMMVGEIIAGTIYGSMALLADGFHMATHAGALAIAVGAYGRARVERSVSVRRSGGCLHRAATRRTASHPAETGCPR